MATTATTTKKVSINTLLSRMLNITEDLGAHLELPLKREKVFVNPPRGTLGSCESSFEITS